MNSAGMCIHCKGGRMLCGLDRCPLLSKLKVSGRVSEQTSKKDFFGPSTSIFVGHQNYPNVFVGAVAAMGQEEKMDNPTQWFGMDYDKLIEMRSLAMRTKNMESIKSKSKFVEDNQLIAMARKPVDVEMNFKRTPIANLSFNDVTQPFGATAMLDKMKLVENPKIPQTVEYVLNDDLKSTQQISELYKHYDTYYITNILSSGVMGKEERKKMVPTRWSITALDDTLGKQLIEKIRNYKEIENFEVYESTFLSNRFTILLMPGKWEYENFETWFPGSMWSGEIKEPYVVKDFEFFGGRKNYADNLTGGYYAARIGVCEALDGMKRQARVLVLREIDEGYIVPVGVWQVRENSRESFKNKPRRFGSLGEALGYIKTRVRLPIERYILDSSILKQRRLQDYNKVSTDF